MHRLYSISGFSFDMLTSSFYVVIHSNKVVFFVLIMFCLLIAHMDPYVVLQYKSQEKKSSVVHG
jgi:hypothetical protein